MTITITTQGHTYIIQDPEELMIETDGDGITFESAPDSNDNMVFIFKTGGTNNDNQQ